MEQGRVIVPREPRLPLFVQVVTEPRLPDCWSVNLSRTGIGLVTAAGIASEVSEGDQIDVAFRLPGSTETVRARGAIAWLYGRRARNGAGAEIAIGVEFVELNPACRVPFERYMLAHKYHVAVAFASRAERRSIETTFGDGIDLHLVDDEDGLLDLLGRGDVSAVVVCGDDEARAASAVGAMLDALLQADGAHLLPPDLMPAVIYCAAGTAEGLIGLFNSGRVFRALERPVDSEALRIAVLEACLAHGERTEQRRVAQSLERALSRQRARERSESSLNDSVSKMMVAESAAMRRVVALCRRVAAHKVSVLLQGETGTGKEVLARLIHQLSPRAGSSMVIQDCGVLTDTLLESELFGHVKGAFTGAVSHNPGLFVMADGGTVFLDEIENTTPDLQAKLLRVIETGMVRPVGGSRVRHVDVRVIAASNRNLREEVDGGRFRADLYFRLNTFPIQLPPLRERAEDILPLAEYFLGLANQKFEQDTVGFDATAARALRAHDWPGNVRELRNAVEAAVLLADGTRRVTLDMLPVSVRGEAPRPTAVGGKSSLKERVRAYERELIRRALEQNRGILRRAARQLATSPVTLRRKAIQYGLAGNDETNV